MSSKIQNCMNFLAEFKHNRTPPPGNRLHYTLLLPKKTFCCLTKCFLPLRRCTYPRVCVCVCQTFHVKVPPPCVGHGSPRQKKKKRSEQNLSLLKATAGSRAPLIVIKFKSSRQVSDISASCKSSSLLLNLVVVILLYVFSPMC